ncbi:MAG: dockerin type I domain-containing protein, partial [Dehalococcoidia bacterium]
FTPFLTCDPSSSNCVVPSRRIGDVNGDGVVNAVDALCVLRYVAGLALTTVCHLTPNPPTTDPVWDVHLGGGPISAVDALCILRSVAGLAATGTCPVIPTSAASRFVQSR